MPKTWEPDAGAIAHAERPFNYSEARFKRGRQKGRAEGIVVGVVATLVIGWILDRMREKAKLESSK